MKTQKCPECGAEFVPKFGTTQVCCSDKCKRARRTRLRKSAQKSGRRRIMEMRDAVRAATPIALQTIMTSRAKPKGCSDVRWRMELRRRARPEYYDFAGCNV